MRISLFQILKKLRFLIVVLNLLFSNYFGKYPAPPRKSELAVCKWRVLEQNLEIHLKLNINLQISNFKNTHYINQLYNLLKRDIQSSTNNKRNERKSLNLRFEISSQCKLINGSSGSSGHKECQWHFSWTVKHKVRKIIWDPITLCGKEHK